jgi:soluble lytic murein transglycosylase-like protein
MIRGTLVGLAVAATLLPGPSIAQDLMAQWVPDINAACAEYGCDPNQLYAIIACESGGDESPAPHPNPYGGSDWGLVQINDATWGDIAYAGGSAQIWFAASLLSQPGGWYHWTCAGGVQ